MKIKIQILIFGIVVIASCTKAQQADKQLNQDIPKEAKTCIITKNYRAIKHDDKWICGEEFVGMHTEQGKIYYDKYGNQILRVVRDGYKIKYYYHSPEKGLIKKIKKDYDGRIDS